MMPRCKQNWVLPLPGSPVTCSQRLSSGFGIWKWHLRVICSAGHGSLGKIDSNGASKSAPPRKALPSSWFTPSLLSRGQSGGKRKLSICSKVDVKSEVLWILWISFPVPVDLTRKGTGPVQGNTTLGRPVLRSKDNAESALRQAFKVCRKSLDRTMEYDSYIYI